MLVGGTLLILTVIVIFNLVLGGGFIGGVEEMLISNEAFIDDVLTTFDILAQTIFFGVSENTLAGAISILTITLISVASLTGISVVGTGLNPQSARIIILTTIFGIVWALLSVLAYGLIISVESFGGMIYVILTIGYVVGVIQKIAGGN